MKKRTIRLDDDLAARLAAFADDQGISENAVINFLVSKLPGETRSAKERKPPGDRQKHQLKIRLDDDQYQAVCDRAELDEWQSPSAWIYSLVVSHLENDPVMTQEELDSLYSLEVQLRRMGNNINQIAKAANQDPRALAQLTAMNFDAFRDEVKKAWQFAEAVQLGAVKRWGME